MRTGIVEWDKENFPTGLPCAFIVGVGPISKFGKKRRSSSMTYCLGIDAGGTKITGVLASPTAVLARAESGSIKITRVSQQEAAKNLDALLSSLSQQSGIALRAIASTCIGLSGNTVPAIEQWTRHALEERLSGQIAVCGDEDIALDGAFRGEPGVLVIAGTGSNVVGRTPAGEVFHLGGWGPVLSDEGSGYRIGLQAVRATLAAMDRGIQTSLYAKILEQWHIQSFAELIDLGNRLPGPDFSRLARAVAACAAEQDAVALQVLQEAGTELGEMALFALKKIQASANATPACLQLAFTGSIVSHVAPMRSALLAVVQREIPHVVVHTESIDAALGAVWRAQQKLVAAESLCTR